MPIDLSVSKSIKTILLYCKVLNLWALIPNFFHIKWLPYVKGEEIFETYKQR